MDDLRRWLQGRLAARRDEIYDRILHRIEAIPVPIKGDQCLYQQSVRAATAAALDYGLATIGTADDRVEPVPLALISQARQAARLDVGLDTVLRRYFAGFAVLSDCVAEEAAACIEIDTSAHRVLGRELSSAFEHLLSAVSVEYNRESQHARETGLQTPVARVRRLLAGQLANLDSLHYGFTGWHVGVVVAGPDSVASARGIAAAVDAEPLIVAPAGDRAWLWLRSRARQSAEALEVAIGGQPDGHATIALGEPAEDLDGWRQTHEQAAAALSIALLRGSRWVRYSEVALTASLLKDRLLAKSLRQLYLAPLEELRDGGAVARETLRAYFVAGRNGASAAAALGVSRRTVASRLASIEERLGIELRAAAVALETALVLDEIGPIDTLGSDTYRTILRQ